MKKSLVAFIVLGLCSLSFAGNSDTAIVNPKQAAAESAEMLARQATVLSPFATAACSFTFTSAANDNFLQYCVTANGNIAQLETAQAMSTLPTALLVRAMESATRAPIRNTSTTPNLVTAPTGLRPQL